MFDLSIRKEENNQSLASGKSSLASWVEQIFSSSYQWSCCSCCQSLILFIPRKLKVDISPAKFMKHFS
jgi:hypothetical protein